MPKQSSKDRNTKDVNVIATQVVGEATGEATSKNLEEESGKNPAAVALGRLGGLKGGKARAQKLTAKQLSDIARRAAQVRWQKVADNQ